MNRIFEGATWDSVKKGFKDAYNGVYNSIDDENFNKAANNFIKNGKYDNTNYQEFLHNKNEYNGARDVNNKAKDNLNNIKANPKNYTSVERKMARKDLAKSKQNRDDAAMQMIGHRPGIIGMGQRSAAMGSVKMGRLANKIKNKATNFVHDKIGLEEE